MGSHLSHGHFRRAAHVDLISSVCVDAVLGQGADRIYFAAPPRHGKSEICSFWLPVWIFENFPTKKVVVASYSDDVAQGFGRRVRDEIIGNSSELTARIGSKATDAWWETTDGGAMYSVGVGGALTSKGADVIIIDDPFKNPEEANSPTMRQKVWDWYRAVIETRLEPGGVVIIMHTRWHEDDLIGRIEKEEKNGGDVFRKVVLPALAEENDPLGRAPGEALWPERFDVAALERKKRGVGSYFWAAMYQQRPAPLEGGLFNQSLFRYIRDEGSHYALLRRESTQLVIKSQCWKMAIIDLATSLRTSADFFTVGVWAVTPDRCGLLIDYLSEHIGGAEHEHIVETLFERHGVQWVGVEKSGFQLSLIQRLRKGNERRGPLPIRELTPDGDKWMRAQLSLACFESEVLFFDPRIPGLDKLERQHRDFPNAAHDDDVDMVSYAADALTGKSAPVEVRVREIG